MRKSPVKILILMGVLLIIAAALAACGGAVVPPEAEQAVQAVATQVCPPAEPCPEPEGPVVEIPYLEKWEAAAHSDETSASFVHWNEDDPAVVAESCAKCHSTSGLHDFLGADGSEVGVVNVAPAVGEVITCVACHNEATEKLDAVAFNHQQANEAGEMVPVTVSGLGDDAVCMVCHQGRASTYSVDAAIEKAAVADEDTVSADLGFINIHYYAAAATRYGTMVKGGYEYEGKSYDSYFGHAEDVTQCNDCHDSHSLELKVAECATCHTGVASVDDVKNIRMVASMRDYDGDGDINEPIEGELATMQEQLMKAMQDYSGEVSGSAIGYNVVAYPYWFVDSDGDGQISEDEAVFDNGYKSWTPRLLKAAYNYQVSKKDPGGYAHNGKYLVELLYDSIEDLNTKIAAPIDLAAAHRTDPGHFDGSAGAFRHWDEDGEVAAGCAKCHSATGLPQYIKYGTNIGAEISSGLQCETCHNDLTTYTLYELASAKFPSGASLTLEGKPEANLCLSCHQGTQSTVSVNRYVGAAELDTVSDAFSFAAVNVHYFAAGATLFGSEAQGMYQYQTKEYAGAFMHVPEYNSCSDCHDAHQLDLDPASCKTCHGVEDPGAIRLKLVGDYDGDGDTTEGLKGEVEGLQAILYAAIQAYAAEVSQAPIIYSSSAYPYFFADTNANGAVDGGEAIFPNAYKAFTPRLLLAAYNYQYSLKDPGSYTHNPSYTMQGLYDSIESLNEQVPVEGFDALVRP